jgi:transcriptional regulator with XRE-family HTH domain
LGAAIRAARRLSRVRIDDLSATAGVSKQFTQDVEHGKPTVQFGRVLKLLAELGIPLELDIPDEAARSLANPDGSKRRV